MASFFLTSSSNVARTLLTGETGFVGEGATLYALADAVTASGDFFLTAMGSIVGDNFGDALQTTATVSNARVTVGAAGSLVSTASTAFNGTVNNVLQLNNAGTISGVTAAIALTATAQSGVVPDYHVANTGRIMSNSASASANTVNFTMPAGGLVDLANAGVIVNGGFGGAIKVVGGRLDLTNSGTIQCRSASTAVLTDAGGDTIDNTGTIIGGISLNDGSDKVTNHGGIIGSLTLGNGSDRLVNNSTITGTVSLTDTLTSGAISDTVVNAGLIIGDVLLGNGNDIYRSKGGIIDGTLFGGAGDDLYIVDQSDLAISDSSGNDTVRSLVDFVLAGGLERLEIIGSVGRIGVGNSGANTLTGGVGDDQLRGAGGDDQLADGGGEGNDLLVGGDGNDILVTNNGDDTLQGGSGLDTAILSAPSSLVGWTVSLGSGTAVLDGTRTVTLRSIETVEGGLGNDTIAGNSAANQLFGGNGADSLSGGSGNDTLFGGSGADTLTGGSGSDVFRFTFFSDSSPAVIDRITDFQQGKDRIDLPDFGAFVFLGTGSFTGLADEVRFLTDSGVGITTVEVRVIGAATNTMEIDLTGIFTLAQDDFLF